MEPLFHLVLVLLGAILIPFSVNAQPIRMQVSDSVWFSDEHILITPQLMEDGNILYSDYIHHSMNLTDGYKVDTLRPFAHNLVLHCEGKFCYRLTLPEEPKFKRRYFIMFKPNRNGYVGINFQQTDLAFYDSQFNLTASYPIEVPLFDGDVVLYHDYFSQDPVALLGDTLAMLLMPTQVLDDSIGKLPKGLPAIALFNISGFDRVLPDTLGEIMASPFLITGKYPSEYKNLSASFHHSFKSGIRADQDLNLFYTWHSGSPEITFYSKEGLPKKQFGRKSKVWRVGSAKSFSRIWRKERPDFVEYWRAPIYSDVLTISSENIVVRLCFGPAEWQQVLKNSRKGGISIDGSRIVDAHRPASIQIYSWPDGKLLGEEKLEIVNPRIQGLNENRNLIMTGMVEEKWFKFIFELQGSRKKK